MATSLPYLTSGSPGIGGEIKQRCEDFRVEEIPLYLPSGEGDHVYFRVVKTGVATPVAVDRIARYMQVRPTDIGVAGLKDAQAVTSQLMSLEHADPQRLAAYTDAQVQVVETSRHTNKLRPGHLAGNRFDIRVRSVGAEKLAGVQAVLDVLGRRGVPNFFGEQRFGSRGDSADLGEALVRGDNERFVKLYLGGPQPEDPSDCRAARLAFDNGDYEKALKHWPRHYSGERRALSAYKKRKHAGPAVGTIDKRMIRLFVSAFQSRVFNGVLSRRLDSIDRVFAGDLAQKIDTGGVFVVEDEAAEQPRAQEFMISPTGPIVGYRCNLAQGEPGQIEQAVLAEHGVDQDALRRVGSLKVKGTRRPLRFRLTEPTIEAGVDEHGDFVRVQFTAPSGCYATVALREIMKND